MLPRNYKKIHDTLCSHALLVPMQGNEVITSNCVPESLEPKLSVLLHIVDGDSGLTVLLQHGKA